MGWSFFCWLTGGLAGAWYGASSLSETTYDALLNLQVFREFDLDLPLVAALTFPIPNGQFFSELFTALTWNSALWEGYGAYLRLFLLMALSFAFAMPLLLSFVSARLSR